MKNLQLIALVGVMVACRQSAQVPTATPAEDTPTFSNQHTPTSSN